MSELKNLRSSEKNTSLQTPEYNKLRSDIISSPGQNVKISYYTYLLDIEVRIESYQDRKSYLRN
jgi:hypothetical protein